MVSVEAEGRARVVQKSAIEHYMLENFDDIFPLNSWGERSFSYNPNKQLTRGTYFATLKEKDGAHDTASFLNRDGVFRLNLGVTKACYLSLFSQLPKRPKKGGVVEGPYDFQAVNTRLPHPSYGWIGWICVLNPTMDTFEKCKYFLEVAFAKAKETTAKKLAKRQHPSWA